MKVINPATKISLEKKLGSKSLPIVNAAMIGAILRILNAGIEEAKAIINLNLLEKYKECKFTNKNTKSFIASSIHILELNKKGLELDFEIGSLVYSLILRIRGLLMIKLMFEDKLYSKSYLLRFLEKNNLSKDKVEELYRIYSNERNNIRVRESNAINKEAITKLIIITKKLLQNVRSLLI